VLRQRYEEARLAAVSSIADVQVLDQASVPFAPVTDRRRLIVAGAIFAFVGVALFAILLIDRSDARVRYPEQVTAGMGLSILGVVPHLKGLNGGGQLVDNSQLAEAFRELRFAVLHAHGSAGPVVLSISSSESGDGKSMVATNLASAFANHGHRVLLIDADVRRGSLHRTLRTRRAPGLTDYLLGTRDLAGVTQTTANGVTLIGSGTRMRNAPELLGSVAMTQLIRAMRSQYTAIIIDTPPLSAGVDAYVLAALAGNLVLVVRTGSTDAQFAEAKLALLDRLPIRVLGAVLNDVPPSRAYRYYSYLPGYEAEDEVVLPLAIAGALEQPSDAH
jgi:capsular exopolysaccharide synthesis family protein